MAPRHNEETPLNISRSDSNNYSYGQHARRRSRCSVWKPLGFLLLAGAILGAILVVLKPKKTLDKEISVAQEQVVVSKEGAYSVEYDTPAPPDVTYAQLAQRMLPPWYEASLMAVDKDIHNKMLPSSVHKVRKVLLMTRNLLDAFSPVFSKHSLWKDLRHHYKEGYELVGYYQDLDHSGVDYSKELLKQREQEVLDWKDDFLLFQQNYNVRWFLYTQEDTKYCTRQKSSHLFWNDMDTQKLPCGSDDATLSLQQLAHVQLSHALEYYTIVQSYDTIVPKDHEEAFHNLRKELRIFLDEYKLFRDVLLKKADQQAFETLYEAETMLGHINDQWTAYNIYNTHKTHPKEQSKLAKDMDTAWKAFLEWAVEQDLASVIQSLLNKLES